MALPLILRGVSRIPAWAAQGRLFKYTPIVSLRDYSVTKNNENSLLKSSYNSNNFAALVTKNFSTSPARLSGDHGKLWLVEKIVAVALLAVVPGAILVPNVVLDHVLASLFVVHFHWGLEACVVDYVRPILFGDLIPKLTMGLLYLLSITTLGGLIYYNTNDIGIGKTVQKIWAVNKEKA